jgi:hypothetical protein
VRRPRSYKDSRATDDDDDDDNVLSHKVENICKLYFIIKRVF